MQAITICYNPFCHFKKMYIPPSNTITKHAIGDKMEFGCRRIWFRAELDMFLLCHFYFSENYRFKVCFTCKSAIDLLLPRFL